MCIFVVRICLCFYPMPWGSIEPEAFGMNFPRPHKLMWIPNPCVGRFVLMNSPGDFLFLPYPMMRPMRDSFPWMILFSSRASSLSSSRCSPSKILACKGPNSDSPFHGFTVSPVSSIAINRETLGSFYWKIPQNSLWYFLTILVSALCSIWVTMGFPLLYKEAQGERQKQHLAKAVSKYISAQSLTFWWRGKLGRGCGRIHRETGPEPGALSPFMAVSVRIAFHQVGLGCCLDL